MRDINASRDPRPAYPAAGADPSPAAGVTLSMVRVAGRTRGWGGKGSSFSYEALQRDPSHEVRRAAVRSASRTPTVHEEIGEHSET